MTDKFEYGYDEWGNVMWRREVTWSIFGGHPSINSDYYRAWYIINSDGHLVKNRASSEFCPHSCVRG